MNIFNRQKNTEQENKKRLQDLVKKTTITNTPTGWIKKTFSVGGLSEVGFSEKYPDLLLVISSQGRGIIDCSKLEMTNRDSNTDYDWMNSHELWAFGVGKLSEEKIKLGGLAGGGLPHSNKFGDRIQFMATEWPIIDLIFEPNFKSIYKKGEENECFRIFHGYELITYGFSYNGEHFLIATSSEINVYRKELTVHTNDRNCTTPKSQ